MSPGNGLSRSSNSSPQKETSGEKKASTGRIALTCIAWLLVLLLSAGLVQALRRCPQEFVDSNPVPEQCRTESKDDFSEHEHSSQPGSEIPAAEQSVGETQPPGLERKLSTPSAGVALGSETQDRFLKKRSTRKNTTDKWWVPRLHVDVRGSGDTFVLLLGGFMQSNVGWSALLRHWPDVDACGCTFLLPDLLGHGLSPWPSAEFCTLEAHARALRDVVERYVPAGSPLHIVGFSFGAALAMRLASDLLLSHSCIHNAILPPLASNDSNSLCGSFSSPSFVDDCIGVGDAKYNRSKNCTKPEHSCGTAEEIPRKQKSCTLHSLALVSPVYSEASPRGRRDLAASVDSSYTTRWKFRGIYYLSRQRWLLGWALRLIEQRRYPDAAGVSDGWLDASLEGNWHVLNEMFDVDKVRVQYEAHSIRAAGVPTLVVIGANDPLGMVPLGDFHRALGPDATFFVVHGEQAQHDVITRVPRTVLPLLARHVAQHTNRASSF